VIGCGVEPYAQSFVASRSEPVVVSRSPAREGARDRTHAPDRSLVLLEEIYREHGPRFRRVALAIVSDVETAEDVVQEAFARALVKRDSFRGSGAPVGWVWRIVVNTALSRRRRGALEDRMLEWIRVGVGKGEDVEGDAGSVREQVARLPESQKVALFLRYYADLEYEAIGEVLSIAPGTVGKLLHDARTSLRTAVDGESRG
jgi:RNA polymerase sigma-70 factor (ECF subfamily)